MAVTSPDNLWTPDSGEPYALTTDMAAGMDTVQDAMTEKAQYGAGTTAQRTAALSRFRNGAIWYDTTTSSEWRKVGGAWVNQDTGWMTVTLASGFQASSGVIQVRAIRNHVYWRGLVQPTSGSFATGSVITIANAGGVPGSARPPVQENRQLSGQSQAASARGYVNADGSVVLVTGTTAPVYIALGGLSGYVND